MKLEEVIVLKIINIKSFTEKCMAQKSGLVLRKLIEEALKNDEEIILDFDGIKLFASPFFNISLGYIISNYGEERFNSIKIINISELGDRVIAQVKNNSLKSKDDEDEISEIVRNIEL